MSSADVEGSTPARASAAYGKREFAYLGTLSSSDNVTASALRKRNGRVEVATMGRKADQGFFDSVADATRGVEDRRARDVHARRAEKEGGDATDDDRFFRFKLWFGDAHAKAAEMAKFMRPMEPLPPPPQQAFVHPSEQGQLPPNFSNMTSLGSFNTGAQQQQPPQEHYTHEQPQLQYQYGQPPSMIAHMPPPVGGLPPILSGGPPADGNSLPMHQQPPPQEQPSFLSPNQWGSQPAPSTDEWETVRRR